MDSETIWIPSRRLVHEPTGDVVGVWRALGEAYASGLVVPAV